MKKFPPKEIQCGCGHVFTIDRPRIWCEKCAKPVFYNDSDKRTYKRQTIIVYGVLLAVITFITYIFLELIVTPYMSM